MAFLGLRGLLLEARESGDMAQASLLAAQALKMYPRQPWVLRMEREHQFDAGEVRDMLAQFKPNKRVIKAINTPATSKPWHFFETLYVTESRVDGGVLFWNENAELLERARVKYGVPEEVVTSSSGIESFYGKRTGRFQVADALYTLGFEVPRRSQFFQSLYTTTSPI